MIIKKLTLKSSFAFILLALLAFSCADTNPQLKTIKKNGLYKIELPDYMEETFHLNNEASLQYQNLFKELYIIVLDEPKDEFHDVISQGDYANDYTKDIQGYTNFLLDSHPEREITGGDIKPVKINGLDARIYEMKETTEDGYDITFKAVNIEGRKKYYQLMVWTLTENMEKYNTVMDNMINSFKEMDRSRKQ